MVVLKNIFEIKMQRKNVMSSGKKHVIVVGGGASGMMAAISAKRQGADVTIFERNARIGKKILATGNGRCNFTNINTDISYYHGNNPKFANNALSQFGVNDTIAFFEKIGIAHKVEELGKVFPMSDQASSVLDVLLYEIKQNDVNIVCNAYVKNIINNNGMFTVKLEDGSAYTANSVIIATGGKAMPSTGSDGNGFELARALGHSVTDIFPGLVQLMLEGKFFKQIDGVKIVGTAEILSNKQCLAKDRGDVLFTNYGVSGPPVLQISRKAGELLQENKEAILKITVIDTIDKHELTHLIAARFNNNPQKTVEFGMVGLINKRLIPVVLKEAGIEDLKHIALNVSPAQCEAIAQKLTDWRFTIRGTKGWQSAQVTAGGIDTQEVYDDTMQSKIVKGLFFAGEIMDIDGQCGGFNLQWAWSSGFVAGYNAAQ